VDQGDAFCGDCGKACNPVEIDGDQYGHCTVDSGTCDPTWSDCTGPGPDVTGTCEELCTLQGYEGCVQNGCGGFTALLFDNGMNAETECTQGDAPAMNLSQDCTEVVQLPPGGYVRCCCAQQ
jgi:hypothetical protein